MRRWQTASASANALVLSAPAASKTSYLVVGVSRQGHESLALGSIAHLAGLWFSFLASNIFGFCPLSISYKQRCYI